MHFKTWVELEEVSSSLREAIAARNIDEIANNLCSYVAIAGLEDVDNTVWTNVALKFYETWTETIPTRPFPILLKIKSTQHTQRQEDAWNYRGRSWYAWAHMIASCYGYSLEYIAEMDFEDAIGLIQEILIAAQLDKEWQWSMSELAYSYDRITKTSKYNPLERPAWMKIVKEIKEPKKMKIPKEMLPVGNVVSMRDLYEKTTHNSQGIDAV